KWWAPSRVRGPAPDRVVADLAGNRLLEEGAGQPVCSVGDREVVPRAVSRVAGALDVDLLSRLPSRGCHPRPEQRACGRERDVRAKPAPQTTCRPGSHLA